MRWKTILIAAAIFIVAAICFSCSPKIVEHISVQRDTTYIERVQVDSVFHRDSIFVEKTGDTIYIYKERERWRYKYLRDTIRLVQIDTALVLQPYPIEKPISGWKQTQIKAFWWLAGALLAALVWIFRKPLRKLLRI